MRSFNFYLPILDAMGVEKDSVRFNDASESFSNWLEALNRFGIVFSVFNFFTKMPKLFLMWGAAWRFFPLGLHSDLCMGWIRVEFWAKRSMHWCIKYLIFNEYFFQSFSCVFDSNHGQILPFLMCTNLQWPMRVNAA